MQPRYDEHRKCSDLWRICLLFCAGLSEHYVSICSEFGWEVDQSELEKLKAKTAEELKVLEEKITDATENLGDSEVREALYEKAQFLCKIGTPKEDRNKNFKVRLHREIVLGTPNSNWFADVILDCRRKDHCHRTQT